MKKTMIRIFSALLALMMLCSIPFAAGAAVKTLSLDENVTLAYDGVAERVDEFTFTPEESGTYVLYSAGEVDLYANLLNGDGEMIASDDDGLGFPNFRLYCELNERKTYIIEVCNYEGTEGESTVCMKKATAATEVLLDLGESFTGYIGTVTHMNVMLMPENALDEEISFSSTDDAVVGISEDGFVELNGVGEATLTAATESGLRATCTVTVKDGEAIAVDEIKTVDSDAAADCVTYKFTATASEKLALYTEGTVDTSVQVLDENLEYLDAEVDSYYKNNLKVILNVEEGKTYYFVVYGDNSADGAATFTLHLAKTIAPTDMELNAPAVCYGYAGDMIYVEPTFLPMNAQAIDYTITSSDPKVAEVVDEAIFFKKVGTATITVKAGALKKTFKIKVLAPEALQENSYATVKLEDSMSYQLFTFKPSGSGNYVFGSTGAQTPVYGYVFLNDTMPPEVYYEDTSNSFTACYQLTKGKTYRFVVGIPFDLESETFRVYAYREGTANCAEGEHSWNAGAITKMPTDKAGGVITTTCSVCGAEKFSVAKQLGAKVNTSKVFSDIKKGDWFYKSGAIDFVYNAGLFKGVSESKFEPGTNMTRGMFVTVLGRLAGVSVKNTESKFTDVPKNQYYSGYVKWASDYGIVSGTSATTFAPDANVTREQICKMMVEYCNYAAIELRDVNKPVTFKDAADISSWAKSYVATCQKAGLVNGSEDGNGFVFNPKGNATRAEVATIINNFASNYLK